jgi:hypothetical protein
MLVCTDVGCRGVCVGGNIATRQLAALARNAAAYSSVAEISDLDHPAHVAYPLGRWRDIGVVRPVRHQHEERTTRLSALRGAAGTSPPQQTWRSPTTARDCAGPRQVHVCEVPPIADASNRHSGSLPSASYEQARVPFPACQRDLSGTTRQLAAVPPIMARARDNASRIGSLTSAAR